MGEIQTLDGKTKTDSGWVAHSPAPDDRYPSHSTGELDQPIIKGSQEIDCKRSTSDSEPDRLGGMADFDNPNQREDDEAVRKCLEKTNVANVAEVAVAGWPEPSPLAVHQQAASYPLDSLPETIRAAVREVVGFIQCPVALGACSALSVISLVGQGLVNVRRAQKLEGPTCLYLLAIADSGERKTTVDSYFTKPVQQWEAEQEAASRPLIKEYKADKQAWEAKVKGLLAAIQVGSKRGNDTSNLEKKLTSLEKGKPERPKVPKILFVDTTSEELAFRLANEWPVGGLLSSEAGLVFGGHAMGRDTAMRNMSLLNSLWGAEPITIDRRTSLSYTLRSARLTIGLAVQPETVRAFLDSSKGLARGIGWLARFLIAWPESTQGTREYKDPPEHWPCLAIFHRRLGSLLNLRLPLNENGELSPTMLDLSTEAKSIWVNFHDEVEIKLRPGGDMAEARDIASKSADYAARMAALFHLFENGPDGTISSKHMKAATKIVAWHLYEARRFVGEIAISPERHNASKLDAWLVGYCQSNRIAEVSVRTIQQMGPSCTRDKRAIESALMELVEAGRVRRVKNGKQNLVKVNPALLGDVYGTV